MRFCAFPLLSPFSPRPPPRRPAGTMAAQQPSAPAASAPASAVPEMTRKEVQEQGSSPGSKVLIVVHNEVLDVTKYVDDHPGGDSVILTYAGRDATSAFEGVGHSGSAKRIAEKLRVATLVARDRVEEKKDGGGKGCAIM